MAQLAPYVSFESLIVLGDAVITATSKQPVLAKDRDAAAIYQDLVKFVEQFTRFRGAVLRSSIASDITWC